MLMICKALVLLIVELIIEYLFGAMLTKLVLKREGNPGLNLLTGFFAYQALFQVIALLIIYTTGILHHLTIAWGIVILMTGLISILAVKKDIKNQLHAWITGMLKYKRLFFAVLIVITACCYYVSINGISDEDAKYYIALMTTSIDTDTLFRYNAYSGHPLDSLNLRRIMVTFEIHGAVLSRFFGIHPLIIARVFRACQNAVLTSTAVSLCSMQLFWKNEKNAIEKTMMSVICFWLLQFPFANTIYTPATFLLYRAYEAKAFTANVIVLAGLYLIVKMLTEKNNRLIILIGIFLWGSMAVSTSAFLVAGAECAVFLLAAGIQKILEQKVIKKKDDKKEKGEKIHAG